MKKKELTTVRNQAYNLGLIKRPQHSNPLTTKSFFTK